jgi:hypothetical protein
MRALAALALLAAGCAHFGEPAIEAPKVAVGDQWVYESTDASRRTYVLTAEVVRVDAEGVVVRRGQAEATYSAPWTMVKSAVGQRLIVIEPGLVTIPFPLEVGRTLKQELTVSFAPGGKSRRDTAVTTVVGWEEVIVPAGRFRAIKVHRDEVNGTGTAAAVHRKGTYWYVPEVRSYVKVESVDPRAGLVVHRLQRYKLN